MQIVSTISICRLLLCGFVSVSSVSAGELHVTAQAYNAEQEDEISLELGEIIEVIHKLLDGWWVVRYEKHQINRRTIGVTQTHQRAVYHDECS